jgi:hypothetical protein
MGDTAMYHYDGSSWDLTNPPSPIIGGDQISTGMWASGPNDAWMYTCNSSVPPYEAHLFHWDGAAWSADGSSLAGASSQVQAMWGSAADDVWAVVGPVDALGSTQFEHWNGSSWSMEGSLAVDISSNATVPMWGSGPSDIWVASAESYNHTMAHWDGTAWSLVPSPPPSVWAPWYLGIWGSGPSDVYAVAGNVVHWDGTAWTTVAALADEQVSAVWGAGADDVWVVGTNPEGLPVTCHWNGSAWTTASAPAQLQSLAGKATNDIWAGASDGSLYHWDGSSWTVGSVLDQMPPSELVGPGDAFWPTLPLLVTASGDLWAWDANSDILHHD